MIQGVTLPTAASISIAETLSLLDDQYSGVADGVNEGLYAFWLGSGISRDRVIGLDGVLAKLLEFLRINATAEINCKYRHALDKIIDMAFPSAEEREGIDMSSAVAGWPCLGNLLQRLWNQYSAVLSVELKGEALDHLLWVGLDFPNTFSAQLPDAEHLAVGILALEGTVTQLATANWDGLLEAAVRELGYDDTFYCVTVTGDDLRSQAAQTTLYKFHGCALRAISDEQDYRKLLIARSAQITGWKSNGSFKIVRDQLGAVIQRSRTLMIGMSAQDENIKHLFASANEQQGWKWSEKPTPIVFSAQDLGDHQRDLLNVVYGEAAYESHRDKICEEARLQAYGKPLLLALVLNMLTAKLQVLAGDVEAHNLDGEAMDAITFGLKHLRDRVAAADDGDRLDLAKSIAFGVARAQHQLQHGTSAPGILQYFPLDSEPARRMKNKLALKTSGQREAAVALGLIGLDDHATNWKSSVEDPTVPQSGALRLTSPNGSARVFLAANDLMITGLLKCGAFEENDGDAVVICSSRIAAPQQRSPSGSRRDGSVAPRYVSLSSLLAESTDIDDLRERFRGEIAL